MIEIDGGLGGGQMLRTALTASILTGKGFHIKDIRGDRSNPGLKNQHLTAVKAAKKLCNAETEGLSKSSTELVFRPQGNDFRGLEVDVGTAGSTCLVLDTLLPVTKCFENKAVFEVSGGTEVKWSPTGLHYRHVKMPLLEKTGLEADFSVERRGFYPKGGGKIKLTFKEWQQKRLELVDRGDLEEIVVCSIRSESLASREVAERQASTAVELLQEEASVQIRSEVKTVESDSPGSAVLVKAVYEDSVAGFDAVGEKGKRAEDVACEAVEDFKSFQASTAAVDSYMADQLMMFAAITSGSYSIMEKTDHVESNAYVLEKFGYEAEFRKKDSKVVISF